MDARRSWLLVGTLAVVGASLGVEGCKKKPDPTTTDDVKKDGPKTKSAPTDEPAPADLAFEMVIKNVDATAKKGADGAGLSAMVGASPFQKLVDSIPDEKAKVFAKNFDPNGSISMVLVAKLDDLIDDSKRNADTVMVVGAAHLKHPDLAAIEIGEAAKVKSWKSTDSKVLGTTVWAIDPKVSMAIIDEWMVVGDGQASLERAGKYAAYLSRKGDKQEHDLYVRFPTNDITAKLTTAGTALWSKSKGSVPPAIAAEIDTLLPPIFKAIDEAGDGVGNFDVKGDYLVMEEKLSATGSLSKWLGAYPTTNSSSMLTMPKGDMVGLGTMPDGLGPLIFASFDTALGADKKMDPADATEWSKQFRAFGGSLGHEFASTSNFHMPAGGPTPGAPPTLEYFFRVELTDAAAAKASITAMVDLAKKEAAASSSKTVIKLDPYKKFGAEGATLVIPGTPAKAAVPGDPLGYSTPARPGSSATWAIRDTSLYIDVAIACTPTLLDDGLDKASKNTWADDAAAKATIDSFPKSGLVSASYGSLGELLKATLATLAARGGGAPPTMAAIPPLWGYATASADGIDAVQDIPLTFFGEMAKMGLAMKTKSAFAPPPPGLADDDDDTMMPPPAPTAMPPGTARPKPY